VDGQAAVVHGGSDRAGTVHAIRAAHRDLALAVIEPVLQAQRLARAAILDAGAGTPIAIEEVCRAVAGLLGNAQWFLRVLGQLRWLRRLGLWFISGLRGFCFGFSFQRRRGGWLVSRRLARLRLVTRPSGFRC